MSSVAKKIKIALLSGGVSREREISLKTGKEIYKELDKKKYEITRYDLKTDLRRFFIDVIDKKFDLIFPALHGPFGEDGKLQGMMDILGVPYVFSGCLASALAMNKYKTKIIARNIGMRIPKDIVLSRAGECANKKASEEFYIEEYNTQDIVKILSLPIVIKPMELGSSVGITIAKTKHELEQGIKRAFLHDKEILLEEYIKGREFTAAVMGYGQNARVLPIIEIIPRVSSWFDYRAKYEERGSDEICPAKISRQMNIELQSMAVMIYRAIGCKDTARIDFMYGSKQKRLYFIEINTIPGMTKTSLAPKAARAAGMEFGEFLDELIAEALKYNANIAN